MFQVERSWWICAFVAGYVADKKADWNLGHFQEEDSLMGKTE
jgi:hypothetical protein